MLIKRLWRGPVWQGEGGGGGGAGSDAAEGGGDGSDAAAAAGGGEGSGAGAATKWWEGTGFTDDQRKHLTASGLTVDDPLQALSRVTDMHRHAMQRLGKDPATLLDRPAKDQPVTEWMKSNREIFGLPENADGYKVEKPSDWPKDAQWDTDFETQAKAFAFEHGIPPAALQGLVGLYAAKVGQLNTNAETQLAAASDQMLSDLSKDWGPQTNARTVRAGQAAQAVAAKAGMTTEQLADVAKSLAPKVGDANVIRLFDTIAGMMGDDVLMGGGAGGGGATSFGTTPAEARQQLAQLQAQGGAYYEAVASGNSAKVAELKPQIERLSKIAAGQ